MLGLINQFRLIRHQQINRINRPLPGTHNRLIAFIRYFNEVLAKPFKWTYTGRPLQA